MSFEASFVAEPFDSLRWGRTNSSYVEIMRSMTAESWFGSHCIFRSVSLDNNSQERRDRANGETYSNNGTSACSRGMSSPSDDVLSGEQPVSPSEASHVVESLQIQEHRFGAADGKVSHANFSRCGSDVSEEFPVRLWSIGAELVKDLGQRSVWHRDLKEMVEERDLQLSSQDARSSGHLDTDTEGLCGLTMLSLAPLSPRKYMGILSLTPS